MNITRKILNQFIDKLVISRFKNLIELEKSTTKLPGVILPTKNSPPRFEIPLEMISLFKDDPNIPLSALPPFRMIPSLFGNMKKVVKSLPKNPSQPLTHASPTFLQGLEDYARSMGVKSIGYTKLDPDLIFQEMGILHENAIVLAMEMDLDKIEEAPSESTHVMIMETYDALGIATNKITEYLRKHGFSAMAGHPLGGLSIYPPLAQNAGIGWIGTNGLLITRKFGPRVRLSAIFTNIENLPFSQNNEHAWIYDYCNACGTCIRECPTDAIRETPLEHDYGRVTHIFQEKCFPYFVENYGCSICIKECPFSYFSVETFDKLKASFEARVS